MFNVFSNAFQVTSDLQSSRSSEQVLKTRMQYLSGYIKETQVSDGQKVVISLLSEAWANRHLKPWSGHFVTLLLGNPFDDFDEAESEQVAKIATLLVQSNCFVLYDADSKSAKVIEAAIAEEHRFGVTSKVHTTKGRLLSIPDPKIRAKIFRMPKAAIISPDSTVGIGLLIDSSIRNEKQKYLILNTPKYRERESIDHLARSLKANPTLPPVYASPVEAVDQAKAILKENYRSYFYWNPSISEFDIEKEIKNISSDMSKNLVNQAHLHDHFFDGLPYPIQRSISLIGKDSMLLDPLSEVRVLERFPIFAAFARVIAEKGYVLYSNGKGAIVREISRELIENKSLAYGISTVKSHRQFHHKPQYLSDEFLANSEDFRWHFLTHSPFIGVHSINEWIIEEIGNYLIEQGSQTESFRSIAFMGPAANWIQESHLFKFPFPKEIKLRMSLPDTSEDLKEKLRVAEKDYKFLTLPKAEEHRRRADSVGQEQANHDKAFNLRERALEVLSSSTQTEFRNELRSRLSSKWLNRFGRNLDKLVFLGMGSPKTSFDPRELQELIQLCRGLEEQGQIVTYDADSSAASIIEQYIPEARLGFTSLPERAGNRILYIGNPFLRMKAMLAAKVLIISPSSVSGIGLLIEGQESEGKTFIIFDPMERWPKNGLARWSQSLDSGEIGRVENLGIKYTSIREPEVQPHANQILLRLDPKRQEHFYSDYSLEGHSRKERRYFPEFSEMAFVKSLSDDSLGRLMRGMKSYSEGIDLLTHDNGKEKPLLASGAVVFGSSKGSPLYNPLFIDTVTYFAQKGLPIATGGSGGFMQVANSVAKIYGTASIGIPLSGAKQFLFRETREGFDQTHTIPVPDYEDRIPLLLYGKDVVIFAPGGVGTMKELATTLVQQGGGDFERSETSIFFVSQEYYRGLYEFLNVLPLGEVIKKRIRLIGSVEDLGRRLDE